MLYSGKLTPTYMNGSSSQTRSFKRLRVTRSRMATLSSHTPGTTQDVSADLTLISDHTDHLLWKKCCWRLMLRVANSPLLLSIQDRC